MKKQLFIYHGNCYDGFTAAWVFNRFRDPRLDGEVEYFPAFHGKEPPDCKGKEVWLVDFTYDRETMIHKVIKPSARTIVMDHHKTAQAALTDVLGEIRNTLHLQRDKDRIVFDMNRCGSSILYDELSAEAGKKAGAHRPAVYGRELWLVDYVEDRDLWKKQLPDTEEISAYLASLKMTFSEWDAANALGRVNVAEKGRSIKRYIDNYGAKAREQVRWEEIDGHKVPTVNIPYMNCSEYVNELLGENPIAPFAASYFRRGDGRWQFSLRSKGEFDVSEIAKKFGGGGHKNAAGFDTEALPWDRPGAGIPDPILFDGAVRS